MVEPTSSNPPVPGRRTIMYNWRMRQYARAFVAVLVSGSVLVGAPATQSSSLRFRPMLHAHNCYPEDGRWTDRLERALGTGASPIAIEQDLVWAGGRVVVSHGGTPDGTEPTLDQYFFARVAPTLDRLLNEHRPETWPAVILHLDFKTNEPAHHRAVWDLLGRYERWLTTAPRVRDDVPQPLALGPLLVLTENGEGQSRTFYDDVPVGARLRIFGTVPTPAAAPGTRDAQLDAAVNAPPSTLIPSGQTNYRRWTNFPWSVVERGGQAEAGDWTTDDAARLKAIVDRAHALGLWVRFYTLNGHPPAQGQAQGWTTSYNFGTLERTTVRWRAAIDAGVDFIATDQYEALAAVLTSRR
jgi:hypothetical protein